MDIYTLRIIAMVVSFIVFVGILAWAWLNRRTQGFQEAAQLPLMDDHYVDENSQS